jgi:hypothetical protein
MSWLGKFAWSPRDKKRKASPNAHSFTLANLLFHVLCHAISKAKRQLIAFQKIQKAINFKSHVEIEIRFHRWHPHDEIFKTRSHLYMFRWTFFIANWLYYVVQLLYYGMQLFFKLTSALPQPTIILHGAILVLHKPTSRGETSSVVLSTCLVDDVQLRMLLGQLPNSWCAIFSLPWGCAFFTSQTIHVSEMCNFIYFRHQLINRQCATLSTAPPPT